MKCEIAQQVFSDHVEETIERPLALTLERHLSQCEECREAYGDFRSTWRVLETFPVVETPSSFRESVLSKVRTQQEAPRKASVWRLSWGSVLGARVPTRAFAWALSALILFALLIRVSPGVFQSTFTGPFGGSVMPAGPGMDVVVRASVTGADADVYQVALNPAYTAGEVAVRVCWLKNGKQLCKTEAPGGRKTVIPILVPQPQGVGQSLDVAVRWRYGGRNYAKLIYLPSSQTVTAPSHLRLSGDVHDALRQIAAKYGVVISADAGTKGRVSLSGRFASAKAVLDRVAAQTGLDVTKEGSRAFRLETR